MAKRKKSKEKTQTRASDDGLGSTQTTAGAVDSNLPTSVEETGSVVEELHDPTAEMSVPAMVDGAVDGGDAGQGVAPASVEGQVDTTVQGEVTESVETTSGDLVEDTGRRSRRSRRIRRRWVADVLADQAAGQSRKSRRTRPARALKKC